MPMSPIESKTRRRDPEVATRLHNGCWCLAAKEARNPGEYVVLGFHSGAGAVQPFATWIVTRSGVTVSGSYHESLFDAVADFAERS